MRAVRQDAAVLFMFVSLYLPDAIRYSRHREPVDAQHERAECSVVVATGSAAWQREKFRHLNAMIDAARRRRCRAVQRMRPRFDAASGDGSHHALPLRRPAIPPRFFLQRRRIRRYDASSEQLYAAEHLPRRNGA